MFLSRAFSLAACSVVFIAFPAVGNAQENEWEEHLEGVLAEVEEAAGAIEEHLGGVEDIFGRLVEEQVESIEDWGEKHGKDWEKWAERFESRMEKWGAQQEKSWNQWAQEFERKVESVADQFEQGQLEPAAISKLIRIAIEETKDMPPIGDTVEGVVRDCLEQLEDAPWESVDGLGEHLAEMAEDFGEGIEEQIEAIDMGELAERVERLVEGQLEHLHEEMAHEHEHDDHGHEHEHGEDDHDHEGHQIEIEIEGGDDIDAEMKQELAQQIRRAILDQTDPRHKQKQRQKASGSATSEELKLEAELKRLQQEKSDLLNSRNSKLKQLRKKVDALRAEVEQLRKENEDLEDELHGDID